MIRDEARWCSRVPRSLASRSWCLNTDDFYYNDSWQILEVRVSGEYEVTRDADWGLMELKQIIQGAGTTWDQQARTEAQWQLGRLLVEGKHLPADTEQGKKLIDQAVRSHHTKAKMWASKSDRPI